MVDHNDILNSKQMLSDRYGTERVHGAAPRDYNWEDGSGGSDLPAVLIMNNLARIDLSRQRFRDGMGNVCRAWVVTVDDNSTQRNSLLKRLPHLGLYELRLL